MHRRTINNRWARAAAATLAALVAVGVTPATPATAAPKRADLRATVTAEPTEVPVEGGWTTMTVEVRNVGTGTANDVSLTISRPAGVLPGSGGENPSPPGWNCTYGEPVWTCSYGSLAAGEVTAPSLRLGVYVPPGGTDESVVVGAVATTTSKEEVLTNNSGSVTYRHVAPDLTVSMVAKPTSVIVGGQVTYWIEAHNSGAATDGVHVELPVPAGMRGVTGNGPYGWDCSLGTDTVTGVTSYGCAYSLGLATGATSEPLTITMAVEQLAPGDAPVATATVKSSSTTEENTANNEASATVTVVEPGILRGLVWTDHDRDGIREAGETGADWAVEGMTVLRQDPADGDPLEHPVTVSPDGTWQLPVKPGRYVVQAAVDPYYTRSFSPPNVGDDATDSDVVPLTDPGSYYLFAGSVVIDVAAGTETVVDVGVVTS
ncbi:SdrD B-like domain-containing protein [Micromonospora sp. WMMD558]|uniref:SdrD B-like domain-containing protein n=1 Tax=Micromonospora sp. WMMD558 TaxID=3403462 RepID=UPI003BF59B3C